MTGGGVAVDRKERLKIPPQPIPKQPLEVRIHNWEEVDVAKRDHSVGDRCLAGDSTCRLVDDA